MDDLNSRNKYITRKDINNILKSADIDKEINDISKYQQAFTHKSYVKNTTYKALKNLLELNKGVADFQDKCNETLEFYGDSIICHVSVEYLYFRYPEFDEGILTKLKTNIVSRTYLAKFARYYNFDEFLLLSNYMENIYGRKIERLLEDAFESFVGAISMDLGYPTAKQFIINSIESCVNFSDLLAINKNYKDRALNYFQMNGWNFPKYEIDCQLGQPTTKTYIVNIIKNYKDENDKWVKEVVCSGIGNTKKDAEQDASYNVLKYYNQLETYEI